MKATTARLGDLCDVRIGRTPSRNRAEFWRGGQNRWLSISDMEEPVIRRTKEAITDFAVQEAGCNLVEPGTLLLSFKLSLGKVAIAGIPLFTNEAIAALPIRNPSELDSRYLYYRLQAFDWAGLGRRAVKGNCLNKDILEEAEIEYPALSEQQRITLQLEQADRLRRTRRYALELSDTFLPAAFLQLFGDPVLNAKDWPLSELEELAIVERGKFTPRPRNDPSYYGGSFPFIQTGDISNSGGRLRSWTQTLNEKGVGVSRSFPPGTVVIAIVGATIGMTAILEVEVYCPDSVVGIQVNAARASKEYIEFLLRFWRPVFLAQAPETARANINLDTLRPLRIPVPTLPLQQQFAALVERVERLRWMQRESSRQSEHFFRTLLHDAFKDGR